MEKINKNIESPFSEQEFDIIKEHLLHNIATEKNVFTKNLDGKVTQSIPGAVIAAPVSQGLNFTQDYLFHWMRDGAITMSSVLALYKRAGQPEERERLRAYLINYLKFLKITQSQSPANNLNVLGEPKFNIDGSLWTGPWGRPQDDGAGLVGIVLTEMANIFLEEQENQSLIDMIYHRSNPCLLKPNLEYIANNWSETAFGAWEEVRGSHFFRLCVQRRALYEGAELANKLGDTKAGIYYIEQAKHIEGLMTAHWTDEVGYYREVISESDYRGGGLNATGVMGLVYGRMLKVGDIFSVAHGRSLSTAYFVRTCFENLYQINLKLKEMSGYGPLIGRYQNDYYDGDENMYGNPWFLTTNNFAEYYYATAHAFLHASVIECSFMTIHFFKQILPDIVLTEDQIITLSKNRDLFDTLINAMVCAGDNMMLAVKMFTCNYQDGSSLHMPEQMDRKSGRQKSATDLTWSYGSTISALLTRERTIKFWQTL